MSTMNIAGYTVRTLRHGMSGAPASRSGSVREQEEIRAAILEAGREFGIVPAAAAPIRRTRWSRLDSLPAPAIYTGDKLKAYRQWLGADSYEATGSIGGSFVSDKIEDYYLTPWELGYGSFVKFDMSFNGRELLSKNEPGPAAQEATAGVEPRGHGEDHGVAVQSRRGAVQVLRRAARQLRLIKLRSRGRRGRRAVGLSMSPATATRETGTLPATIDPAIPLGH